jgi:hypothetical protein
MKKESFWSFLTNPPKLPLWEEMKRESHASSVSPSTQGQFVLGSSQPTLSISLDEELLRLSPNSSDRWFLRDAVRGTEIFGATGSGKTSGSGRKIKTVFLKKGMGGLVLCVKTDEADEWEAVLKSIGRLDDLIRIRAGSPLGFNFLDGEQVRNSETGGGLVQNITDFFLEVISVIDRGNSSSSDGGFWERVIRELLTNAVVIASHLNDSLTIPGILKVIDLSPQKPRFLGREDGVSSAYREPAPAHPFDDICHLARHRCEAKKRRELEESIHYFNSRFAALADKTRSIVVSSFTSMADPLLREPLLSLFCGKTAVKPEDAFSGKVIVVDLPVHSFQMTGKIANLIWKTAFKRACQQRIRPESPVFFWIDESQYLVDPSDGDFQTTARSSLCCSVFLTQTISNLYAEFGDRAAVEALLSCLHTKIFHQNDDYETNAWASKTIQKLPTPVTSKSREQSSFFSSQAKHSVTESTPWEDDVPGRAFLNLKSGGPESRFLVEGIVLYGGKKFSNGKPWLKAVFNQKEKA